jgi:hypothetical protein
VERRAKEYEVVLREDIFGRASGAAGAVVVRAAGSAERAGRRFRALMGEACAEPES